MSDILLWSDVCAGLDKLKNYQIWPNESKESVKQYTHLTFYKKLKIWLKLTVFETVSSFLYSDEFTKVLISISISIDRQLSNYGNKSIPYRELNEMHSIITIAS